MGIGVPISKVVPGKANQPRGNAAKPKGGEAGKRSLVPASHGARQEAPLRRRSGTAAETQRSGRRSEEAATAQHGTLGAMRQRGATGNQRATGKRRARRRDDVTRQRGATGKRGAAGSRTLRLCTMEGRSLDNPTRGNPALRPGRKDRNASGKPASRSGGSRESERK